MKHIFTSVYKGKSYIEQKRNQTSLEVEVEERRGLVRLSFLLLPENRSGRRAGSWYALTKL